MPAQRPPQAEAKRTTKMKRSAAGAGLTPTTLAILVTAITPAIAATTRAIFNEIGRRASVDSDVAIC